jgi:hypothetical protein
VAGAAGLRDDPGGSDAEVIARSLADPEFLAIRTRARRRRRLLAAGGMITAAAAAAIVVPAVLPGSATGTFATKAWAVERHQDGTVTVSFDEVATDPAALQRALRADGVYAFVRVSPVKIAYFKGGGKDYYPACNYSFGAAEPGSVQLAVVVGPGSRQLGTQSWIIRPSAMPDGSSLLIVLWSGPVIDQLLRPLVLDSHQPPTCVPSAGRIFPEAPASGPAGPPGA